MGAKAQLKQKVPSGATTVQKRITSQNIKELGNCGIRALAESFSSPVTKIRVVHAAADLLVSSKIPLYMEAMPGPGSLSVIHRAFANSCTDYITVNDHGAIQTLPPVPEVIKISSSSSSPPSADSKHPSHRSNHQPKKAKTPDSNDFPLHRARKRTSKKSKPVVSDSEEISDADDDLGIKKNKVFNKAVIRVAKGKERAVGVKKAPINVDAAKGEEAMLSAAPLATTSRKQSSLQIMTAANTSNAPPSTKLAPRPLSEWAAVAQALAVANMEQTTANRSEITSSSKLASKEPIAASQSTTEQPISTIKPKPCPIKKATAVIWDNSDPFLLKPSGEQQLQGPGQAPKAHTQPASLTTTAPKTTSTQAQSKPSALGPPCLPSTAPTQSTSKPSSKRIADSEKAIHNTTNKKPRTVNEVAEASEELASEGPTAVGVGPLEEVAAESAAQGYQWPYGGYYPPYGYPPPPGWGYQPWSQDCSAGSGAPGLDVPHFPHPHPPPHHGLPYPPPWSQDHPAGSGAPGSDIPHFPPLHPGLPYPPPHGYYPPVAAAAHPAYAKPPAKPAQGEPGPLRLT